jgi:glycosyltransferase involved in cell wall biosynthesis
MPSTANGRYCVVIPAFNAAKTIGALVRGVKRQGLPVLVVNDGSEDETAPIASREGAVVISHLRNEGKGRALRTGFEYALRSQYDGVITMDSDGQHDPAEIAGLIQTGERQHAGIVIGNRMATTTMPFHRRCVNRVLSGIVSAIARQQIPDSQSGFRLIHKEVLASLSLTSQGFEIETELLLAAAKRRWKTISVPVRTSYDNHASHIRPVRDGLRFFWVVCRYLR